MDAKKINQGQKPKNLRQPSHSPVAHYISSIYTRCAEGISKPVAQVFSVKLDAGGGSKKAVLLGSSDETICVALVGAPAVLSLPHDTVAIVRQGVVHLVAHKLREQ